MKRFLVISSTGYLNLGDDAMYESVVRILRRFYPRCKVVHYVSRGQRVQEDHLAETIHYRSTLGGFARMFPALFAADALLLVGGSVIQDVQGLAWRRWFRVALLGRMALRRTVFVGCQAYEPLTERFRRALRFLCRTRVRFLARDKESAEMLRRYGSRFVEAMPDPVFGLFDPAARRSGPGAGAKRTIGINLRQLSEYRQKISGVTTEEVCRKTAAVIRRLRETEGARFRFFSFAETGTKGDSHCYEILRSVLGADFPLDFTPYERDPAKRLREMSKLDFFIGMRLHSIVFAILAGVPRVGIAYDPKVRRAQEGFVGGGAVGLDFAENLLENKVKEAATLFDPEAEKSLCESHRRKVAETIRDALA